MTLKLSKIVTVMNGGEVAKALIGIIEARLDENWLGQHFPSECEDGGLKNGLAAYNIIWPADWRNTADVPNDGQIFDLIEFTYEHIALPETTSSTLAGDMITSTTIKIKAAQN